ncbi:MAG TPA: AtpZ/AtpI family protein [Anaerolineales bacterium]|jgi:ABC-type transport system involved in cytochrome c biogenesis permease subunit
MNDPKGPEKNRQQYVYNLTLAAVAGQVGCLTLVIIFGALIAGLWLDRYFATKPLFTILLMIASMPITLYLMFRVVQGATNRIRPIIKDKSNENLKGGSES